MVSSVAIVAEMGDAVSGPAPQAEHFVTMLAQAILAGCSLGAPSTRPSSPCSHDVSL